MWDRGEREGGERGRGEREGREGGEGARGEGGERGRERGREGINMKTCTKYRMDCSHEFVARVY